MRLTRSRQSAAAVLAVASFCLTAGAANAAPIFTLTMPVDSTESGINDADSPAVDEAGNAAWGGRNDASERLVHPHTHSVARFLLTKHPQL